MGSLSSTPTTFSQATFHNFWADQSSSSIKLSYNQVSSIKMESKGKISFVELIEGLLERFKEGKESVDIDDVIEFFSRYESNPDDWIKFSKWDKYRYTRNLMHEGNGNFNLILMCWPEGTSSPIHDHSDAHCFMRVLEGQVKEVKYGWPEVEGIPPKEMETTLVNQGQTIYMSDELGLHKVENSSHTNKLISVYLYSPPFNTCKVFDHRTGKDSRVKMNFYSKHGVKEEVKKTKAVECTK